MTFFSLLTLVLAVFQSCLIKVQQFDTVDHDTLLQRLSCVLRLQGAVLEWFASENIFCECREMFSSSWAQISYGFPHGPVLGCTV